MEVLSRLGGRPLCWVLGHRVGPAQVRRSQERGRTRLLRVSRCTRCGHSFAGESSEQTASPAPRGDRRPDPLLPVT